MNAPENSRVEENASSNSFRLGSPLGNGAMDPSGIAHELAPFQSCTYRFQFRALDKIFLRKYSGSTWRGLFGNALKQTACVTNHDHCQDCLLFSQCAYPYIFETPAPEQSDRMRKYPSMPHPYLFKVPNQIRDIEPGGLFTIDMRLFGRANHYLPYILQSFVSAGRLGITSKKAHFEIVSLSQMLPDGSAHHLWQQGDLRIGVAQSDLIDIPEMPEAVVQINLLTPLRLLKDRYPLSPNDFRFHHLFRAVLRRIPMLMYFHQSIDLELPYQALSELSRQIRIFDVELEWLEWKRYSNRQNTEMNMGGLGGHFCVDIEHIKPLWPLLWLGQYAHAGKATTMGNGEYHVTW